jgi:hypothetical protein
MADSPAATRRTALVSYHRYVTRATFAAVPILGRLIERIERSHRPDRTASRPSRSCKMGGFFFAPMQANAIFISQRIQWFRLRFRYDIPIVTH